MVNLVMWQMRYVPAKVRDNGLSSGAMAQVLAEISEISEEPVIAPLPMLARHERPMSMQRVLARGLLGGVVFAFSALIAVGLTTSLSTVWVMYAGLLVWAVRRRRSMIGMAREHEDALSLLMVGESAKAREMLADLCRRSRTRPPFHALFLLGLAGAELNLGMVDQALARLQAVRDSKWLTRRRVFASYVPVLHARMAMAHALRGESQQARDALDLGCASLSAARRGSLLLAETLVLSRIGAWQEALNRIEADGARARQLLPAGHYELIHVFERFCQAKLGRSDYRSAALTGEIALSPAARAQVRAWVGRWPELDEYLAVIG